MNRNYASATALLLAAFTPLAAHAATGTWASPAGGSWADPGNWVGATPNAPGDAALFDSALLTSSTITLDAPRTLGSLTFNNSSAAYTLASGAAGALLLDNGTSPASITVSAGTHTIAAPVQLLSDLNVTAIGLNSKLKISGDITGNHDLSFTYPIGGNTITLSGANSFKNLSLTNTWLAIGDGGATGSLGTGSVTLATSSLLKFNLATPTTLTQPVSGSGYVWQAGSAPLTIQAPVQLSAELWNDTTLILDYSVVTSSLFTATRLNVGAGSTTTLLGKTGAASFQTVPIMELKGPGTTLNVVAGVAGTLSVSSGPSYFIRGDVTVNLPNPGTTYNLTSMLVDQRVRFSTGPGSTVNFNASFSTLSGGGFGEISLLGGGTFLTTNTNANGAIFRPFVTLNNRDWASQSGGLLLPLTTYVNDTWAGGDVTVTTDSLVTNGSANSLRFASPAANTLTLAGVNTLPVGILVAADVGAHTSTITGGTLSAGTLTLNQMNTAGDLVVASAIALLGAGSQLTTTNVIKLGPGTAVLAAQNKIKSLTISVGSVRINHPDALSVDTAVTANATLDLNGFSQTIGNLFGTGMVDNTSGTPATLTLRSNASGENRFTGVIQNSGAAISLFLNSPFRQVKLVAHSTYSGDTTIYHSTLVLDRSVFTPYVVDDTLPATTTLKLINGTLSMTAVNGYTRSQTLNGVALLSGSSAISQPFTSATTSLFHFGPITRTPGATLDLVPFASADPAAGMTTTTLAASQTTALGGWVTVSAVDWATTTPAGRLLALAPAAYAPNGLAPGANTDVTSSFSTASPSTATLRFTGTSSTSSTLTLLAATTVIASGGILQTASVNNPHVIAGGSLTSGNGTDLVVHTYSTSNAFTLAAPVADNGQTPIGLTKAGPGTLALAAAGTYTGPTAINAGTLRLLADQPNLHAVTGDGTLALAPAVTATVSALQLNALNLSGSLTLRPAASPAASTLSTLTLSGTTNSWTALLDLTNVPLLVQATTSNKAATLSALQNQLAYAKTHPSGITSSTTLADPTHKTTLLIDNALLGLTAFYGTPADTTSLLVLSTWLGDANLDRKVNVTDLGTLATFYGQSVGAAGPLKGDFNNDGVVNVTDLGLLATNYGQGTAPDATFPLDAGLAAFPALSVPEPASLAILVPAFFVGRISRRQKK